MNPDLFLHSLADSCRGVVTDTVNAVSVCVSFEDASLVGFMHLHRLCGIRLLMLPLAEALCVSREAESVFDNYFRQLEDIKSGSISLLAVTDGHPKTTRSAAASAL